MKNYLNKTIFPDILKINIIENDCFIQAELIKKIFKNEKTGFFQSELSTYKYDVKVTVSGYNFNLMFEPEPEKYKYKYEKDNIIKYSNILSSLKNDIIKGCIDIFIKQNLPKEYIEKLKSGIIKI